MGNHIIISSQKGHNRGHTTKRVDIQRIGRRNKTRWRGRPYHETRKEQKNECSEDSYRVDDEAICGRYDIVTEGDARDIDESMHNE